MRKSRRDPVVYDNAGNYLGGVGDVQDTRSFGASFWEFLHPSTVQQEYAATGQAVPSTSEVMGDALYDMSVATTEEGQALKQNAATLTSIGFDFLRWGVFAMVAYFGIQVMMAMPKRKPRERVVNPRRKR